MNTTLSVKDGVSSFALQMMQEKLDEIGRHLEEEVLAKQALLDRQQSEIQRLRRQLADKDEAMRDLRLSLRDCRQQAEGHQQLANKLLNDISGYHNDIDWYKSTYEKRTFLGVIREKLSRAK